jgi:flavin reductase (DIM6/NTAB) family NADH-FMN oxidoreductase RutF
MSLAESAHQLLRKVLLGPTDRPLCIDVPLQLPQSEVSLWLHGLGEPRDVTAIHSIASFSPFHVCIGFEPDEFVPHAGFETKRLSLEFRTNSPSQQRLAEIGLEFVSTHPAKGRDLALFRGISCKNFCLPAARLWAHDLFNIYGNWKSRKSNGQDVSAFEMRCNAVVFLCPRPVVLVSVLEEDRDRGNIFPMNLFGSLGGGYFGFALNGSRTAAPLVNRIRRVALSNIPYRQKAATRDLRGNHRQASIRWQDLPFATRRSKTFDIPVPEFALRICELSVEDSWPLGTHTFFVARLAGEEVFSEESSFHMIYGQYAALRQDEPVSMTRAVAAS